MDPKLPQPDYLREFEWYWPFDKFSLDPNDLFTTLHDRFNTKPSRLQSPAAFHKDVYECANISDTIDEFYSRLEQRKAQRIEEMSEAWDDIATLLIWSDVLSCQSCRDPETGEIEMKPGTKNDSVSQRWSALLDYRQSMSFDTLITFFDGYVRDKREEKEKRLRWTSWIDEDTEQAAKRAAVTSGADEATTSGSSHRASSGISRSKLKSRRNASVSTAESSAASAAAAAEEPQHASSSTRIGPLQADGSSPGRVAESSRAGKRRNDEDAPPRKRRRMASEDMGAEDVDTGRPDTGEEDALKEIRRKNRARRSANQGRPGSRSPSTDGSLSSYHESEIPETQIPEDFRTRRVGQFIDPTRPFYMRQASRSISRDIVEVTDASQEIPQADEDELARGLTEISTAAAAAAADTKKPKRSLQKKPRASNRQRVEKRRSTKAQDPSSPKKQSRRKKPQARNPSPSAQRLLRSTRSSRRESGQELWFLGDDSVARAVGNTKRT
ncbi:hypothetical protein ACQKWADRAFT_307924 [Trichoderma austrokoningii]